MRKIKGIPLWEQYIEFMVTGAVVVLLIVFLAMQFIGQGNAVNNIRPAEVNDLLAEEARRLEQAFNSAAPVSPSRPNESFDAFSQRLVASVSAGPSITLPTQSVPPGIIGELPPINVVFVEPELGAPSRAVVTQHFDSLAEGVVEQHERLQRLFPSTPHDVTWLTIAAMFDFEPILAKLRAPDSSSDRAPVPSSWLAQMPIVDVRIERETDLQGQWGERVVIDCLPDQYQVREQLAAGVDATLRDSILRALAENGAQAWLTQPQFLPTRNNSWTPPDMDEPSGEGDENQAEIDRMVKERRDRIARRQQVLKELEENCGGPEGGPGGRPGGGRGGGPEQPGPRPPGGGGGGGVGGGGGDGPMAPPRDGGGAGNEVRCNKLRQELAALNKNIERGERILRQLGIDLDAPEAAMEIDPRLVWGHDLTVETGKTYRYRVVVEVYNPFFARRVNLVDSQQHLAESFTIRSEAGEWSDPIYVRPPIQTFITRLVAQDAGPFVVRRARAQVFRYFDGRWWSSEFTLEPGHRVGGVHTRVTPQIDYSSDWFVVDIIEDIDGGDVRNGGSVVLQRLGQEGVLETRQVADDIRSPLFHQLRDEVRMAEAEQG